MRPAALCIAILCFALPAVAKPAAVQVTGAGGVRVLENPYLRVSVRVPEAGDVAGYGTRFTWGGWIEQITFRPDAVDYLWCPKEGRSPSMGYGLPEEFELPILADEDAAVEHWVKVGVGLLRRAKSAPGRSDLEQAPPWLFEEVALPRGGRALRFAQSLEPVNGIGYRFEKEVALDPDSATLRLRLALQNTGTRPFRTEWYSHPFAAPGGYGPDCWQEVPYRLGTGDDALIEQESHPIPDFDSGLGKGASVWGWLTQEQIGGPWHAFGNTRTGHTLAGLLSEDPIRFRVWKSRETYALEPFLPIELAPGQVKHWDVAYLCGRGLDAITGVGSGGAVRLDTEGLAPGKAGRVRLRFAPARPLARTAWTAEATGPKGERIGRWRGTFRDAKPDRPGKAEIRLTPPAGRVTLRVTVDTPAGTGSPLVRAVETLLVGQPGPTARRRHQAHGDRALIVTADPTTRVPLDVVYLHSYLRWAGFIPEVAGPERLSAGLLNVYRCILIPGAGLPPLTAEQAGGLAAYVDAGGGLVHTAPLVLAGGLGADILPIEAPTEKVESARFRFFYGAGGFPQEGAVADVVPERIHLRRALAHPLTDDLALYPEAPQSIARIEKVRPREGARVLLTFTREDAPALVLGRKGRGRVALFAAPVAWGEPPNWVIWGRMAEYHRKLFAETALWAAGLVPE